MKRLPTLLVLVVFSTAVWGAVEPGKTYRIMPEENKSKSLFVNNSSLSDHAAVVLWTETDVPAQQWTVVEGTGGELAFKNV